MNSPAAIFSWLDRQQLPLVLVWACLLVLPIGRVVEVLVILMSVAGIVLLFKHWRTWRYLPAFKLFYTVFLLAWIPILVSLVDAVRWESTAMMSVNHLRFAFSGLFIVHVLATPAVHQRFLAMCAWLLLFWVVDGIIQLSFGRDLFGFVTPQIMPGVERVNALFGTKGLVYGTVLTVFCPLLWEHARRNWARWQLIAMVFATTLVVLVGGTRSAWISICVLLLGYGVLLSIRQRRLPLRMTAVAIVSAAVTVSALWLGSEQFAARINTTLGTFTGTTDSLSDAVRHRTWIARGAVNMIQANPVNGVGAGGFRYAFPTYADPDDPYLNADPPISPYHSHNLWLEILSESGIIGALGLLALLTLLVAAGIRAPASAQKIMLPYALCLLVAYFPFNTHMAIYSAFWSQILWWLIALYCAAYGAGLAPTSRGDTGR
jgi:O-antigen ligase